MGKRGRFWSEFPLDRDDTGHEPGLGKRIKPNSITFFFSVGHSLELFLITLRQSLIGFKAK